MATISFTLNDCLKELADVASSRVKRYENEVSQTRWLDELGRLRIWAGNTGALQCDQLSLDYRLRDASHLKNEISRILQRVLQVVRNLSDLLNEPEDTLGDEALLDPAGEVLNEEDLMTDAQMLHQSLHNAINLLNQLSLETRKPADHDILLNVSSKDVSLFEPWAQQHVSRAFPNLDEGTLHRLSAAMTKQRAVLQYRLQKPRPSRGIDGSEPTLPEREATGSSQAGSLNQLQLPETFTFKLQPPYPTSAFFIDHDSVSIPSPPETSTYSSLFECPYCGSLMTIKDSEEWVCHIFEDLTPYACLSSDCTTPFKLYESRSQWYHHICETHFVSNNNGTFNCPLCKEIFGPPVTFDRHVGEHLEQLALLVFREGPDLTIPDPASQDGSSKVSKGPTLPVSDLRIQEPANDRLAAENTSTGSAAERSLEADQQSVEPFDNPSEIPMALSEDMTHLQTPESPIDNDKNMSLPPDLSSQAAQKTTAELQDEFDPLSPTGSMSSIELVSPVDIDRKSDCSPVPSSKQTFDRQAAFNRFFPELVHSLPQVSTESRAGPREPPEANRASPTHERGRKSTQYLSEYQSPILDDFDVYLKLQSSRRNLASSDDEEKMAISAYSPSPDLSGRRLSPPENNRPTKLMASILPTYHDYTSNDLNEEGDEYIQIKFDDVGETKVDFLGYLRHDREYRCQTFRLPHRGKKLFMLSAQCADALSFRSSRALFMNYRSLHGMVASSVEKETMMEKHILPVEGQQRDVTFVSARSIFLQFGCRIIANGRRFRDDYWESRAREEGFTEANIRDDQQTSVARPRTGLVISKEEDVSKREMTS
ncbi:uncharacterized protein N7503_008120 [Penicillium pulvis]|uniref:uncharacterized protein n=1 Tax=Penicillium pulvis TaxID=1562058 RepID=UPI0025483C21|nr:uncharacterized protein N7503_008120 [Penicillium pulvis]KAJ5792142.1 hypothetical protein N7503_008120 [Penicillium pulvis]